MALEKQAVHLNELGNGYIFLNKLFIFSFVATSIFGFWCAMTSSPSGFHVEHRCMGFWARNHFVVPVAPLDFGCLS
jgi:hypothetical protein